MTLIGVSFNTENLLYFIIDRMRLVVTGLPDFVNILFDIGQELFVLTHYLAYAVNVFWLILVLYA